MAREIRRHHTSAHLLQRALRDVLGDEVVQAGSWVGIERMRFDFRSPGGALTPEQRLAVTRRVNEMIRADDPLVTEELPLEDAHQTGAIAMAGEHTASSCASCARGLRSSSAAGPTPHSTGELGLFVMLSESSIGSGIRRIEAAVSKAAETYVEQQQSLVGALSETLAAKPEDLLERVGKLQTDVRDLQRAIGEIKARLAANDAQTYVERAESINGRALVAAVVPEANAEALKHLSNAIRARLRSGVVALVGVDDGKVSLLVTASDDLVKSGVHAGNLLRAAAPFVEGKGGGAPAQAQGGGKNAAGAGAALAAIREALAA